MKTPELIRTLVLLLVIALSDVALNALIDSNILFGTGLEGLFVLLQLPLILIALFLLFGFYRGGQILISLGVIATPLFIILAMALYPPGALGVVVVIPASIVTVLVGAAIVAIATWFKKRRGQLPEGQSLLTKGDFFSTFVIGGLISVAYIGMVMM